MSDEDGSYRVGYRKPPREHQFRKGQTGNPKGRPKKNAAKAQPAMTWLDTIRKASQQTVKTADGIEMTFAEALVLRVFTTAIKDGKPQALRTAASLMAKLSETETQLNDIPSEEELAALGPLEIAQAYKKIMGTA